MNKDKALSSIEGVIAALKELQEKEGRFATIHCSVVENRLEDIKALVEKI